MEEPLPAAQNTLRAGRTARWSSPLVHQGGERADPGGGQPGPSGAPGARHRPPGRRRCHAARTRTPPARAGGCGRQPRMPPEQNPQLRLLVSADHVSSPSPSSAPSQIRWYRSSTRPAFPPELRIPGEDPRPGTATAGSHPHPATAAPSTATPTDQPLLALRGQVRHGTTATAARPDLRRPHAIALTSATTTEGNTRGRPRRAAGHQARPGPPRSTASATATPRPHARPGGRRSPCSPGGPQRAARSSPGSPPRTARHNTGERRSSRHGQHPTA